MRIERELTGPIRQLLTQAKDIAKPWNIILVASLRRDQEPIDKFSILCEHYAADEIDSFIQNLRRFGFKVTLFDSDHGFFEYALQQKTKGFNRILVYNMSNGGSGPGQTGLLPAFCHYYGIPFANSNPHAHSITSHKYHTNVILRNAGVSVPDSWHYEGRWLDEIKPEMGAKVIAKPLYESSSYGIDSDNVLHYSQEAEEELDGLVKAVGQPLIIQQFIAGYEATVPVLKLGDAPPFAPYVVGFSYKDQLRFGENIRTYRDVGNKQVLGRYNMNALLPEASERMQRLAVHAFEALGLEGVARIDFRVSDDEVPFVNDVNAAPSPTPGSAFSYSLGLLNLEPQDVAATFVVINLYRLGLL